MNMKGIRGCGDWRADHSLPRYPVKLRPLLDANLLPVLARIADALERLAPAPPAPVALADADAFVWHPDGGRLQPVPHVAAVRLDLLQGIELRSATVCCPTRCASPPGCRPTTPCCGARAAPASPRW